MEIYQKKRSGKVAMITELTFYIKPINMNPNNSYPP